MVFEITLAWGKLPRQKTQAGIPHLQVRSVAASIIEKTFIVMLTMIRIVSMVIAARISSIAIIGNINSCHYPKNPQMFENCEGFQGTGPRSYNLVCFHASNCAYVHKIIPSCSDDFFADLPI